MFTPRNLGRREVGFLVLAGLCVVAAVLTLGISRPSVLRVAVGPDGGTEPALMRAFQGNLARGKTGLRLDVKAYAGSRESADAMASGRADLAVVRPDILMPPNGLVVAVLREIAVLVAAPSATGIKAFQDLTGKRLGMLAARAADADLLRDLAGHYGVRLKPPADGAPGPGEASLVPVPAEEVAAALGDGRIDAMAMVTTPTSGSARKVVAAVREAAGEGETTLFGVPDSAAVLARHPRLQSVTVPATTFGGTPRLPDADLATVGTAYMLVARADLSRSVVAEVAQALFERRVALAAEVPAAESIAPPAYEDTAEATSARLPNHPGAVDYYERETETFIERYESWIYLVAILAGGFGSTLAWLRQRLGRIRRARVEFATARLVELRCAARREPDPARLEAMASEIDDLAGNVARHALRRPAGPQAMDAAAVAIDAARSTVARSLARAVRAPSLPREANRPNGPAGTDTE